MVSKLLSVTLLFLLCDVIACLEELDKCQSGHILF